MWKISRIYGDKSPKVYVFSDHVLQARGRGFFGPFGFKNGSPARVGRARRTGRRRGPRVPHPPTYAPHPPGPALLTPDKSRLPLKDRQEQERFK